MDIFNMEDFENKPDEKETPQDLSARIIEEYTKVGAVAVTEEGKERRLYDGDAGGVVEIDNDGTKWRIDPKTGERIGVVEYGDISEN